MTDRTPTHLDELCEALACITDAELREALINLDTPERRAELARRLAPYQTPVTEATMQRGCGPAPRQADISGLVRRQAETLRDAARMLARVRGMVMSPDTAADINEMIDRCNLAAMGVATVPETSAPREVLAAYGWTALGDGSSWYHSEDSTAVDTWGGAARVTGERNMSAEELRAFVALTEGPTQ